MSDPQINIEIEDVLASIRRLVSEGEVPRGSSKPAAAPASAVTVGEPALADFDTVDEIADAVEHSLSEDLHQSQAPDEAMTLSDTAIDAGLPDRLVLSPEQMVSVPQQAREPVSEPLLLTPEHLDDELAGGQGEDEIMTADAAESVDLDDSQKTADESGFPETDRAEAAEPDDVTEAEMWHSVRHETPQERPAAQNGREYLLSTIEDLESRIAETTDDFEPDGSETTPVVDWAETTANGAIFGARAASTKIVDLIKPDKAANAGTDAAAVSVEEAPGGATRDEPTVADIAQTLTDTAKNAVAANLDEELSAYLAVETTLDEEALREMVRDIVRQELQGALGERITRNVRKLVRREIYRVLASEEFN